MLLLCWTGLAIAQSSDEPAPTPEPASEAPADAAIEAPAEDSQRTTLNLLGQVDSASGEGRRNENVQLTLIDNNVLKEINARMGTTATIIPEFESERRYFGNEFGGSPAGPLHVTSGGSSGRPRQRQLDARQQHLQRPVILPGRQRAALAVE